MEKRSLAEGLRRGLLGRCPNCGSGRLFRAYLKVEEHCPTCGHDNGRYRADDAPAYFTIFLVGHLIIAPVLVFEVIWQANPWMVVGVTLPALALACLLLLPRIKGAVLGVHWAMRVDDPSQ